MVTKSETAAYIVINQHSAAEIARLLIEPEQKGMHGQTLNDYQAILTDRPAYCQQAQ